MGKTGYGIWAICAILVSIWVTFDLPIRTWNWGAWAFMIAWIGIPIVLYLRLVFTEDNVDKYSDIFKIAIVGIIAFIILKLKIGPLGLMVCGFAGLLFYMWTKTAGSDSNVGLRYNSSSRINGYKSSSHNIYNSNKMYRNPNNVVTYKLVKNDKAVYIGSTNNPKLRNEEHSASRRDYDYMKVTSGRVSRTEAERREARNLHSFRDATGRKPRYNKTYNGKYNRD
jgi:hypothetical protein